MTQTARSTLRHPETEAGWRQSLGTGAAEIALLHLERARAGTSEWATAHQWVAAMTRDPVRAHPDDCGLYRGAPAVAFTLQAARQPAYTSALEALDGHIATVTRHRLTQAHARIDRQRLPQLREFDLISGLTGLGVYLYSRHGGSELLCDVLTYLVRLTQPLGVDGESLPGWWSAHGPTDRPSAEWPGGHGNLGVAHGIAGPLALLSVTLRRSLTVPGQPDAVDRICAWLEAWRRGTGTGTHAWWPGVISRAEWRTRSVRQPGPQRPSWCYGIPGLVRAQQLAALALDDPLRRRSAEGALAGCITDEQQLSRVTDASLCHGWAGLLHATRRVAADADSDLHTHLPRLHARLTRHLDRHGLPDHEGLLEGAAGIRLVQHATMTDARPVTGWDACLLLDG